MSGLRHVAADSLAHLKTNNQTNHNPYAARTYCVMRLLFVFTLHAHCQPSNSGITSSPPTAMCPMRMLNYCHNYYCVVLHGLSGPRYIKPQEQHEPGRAVIPPWWSTGSHLGGGHVLLHARLTSGVVDGYHVCMLPDSHWQPGQARLAQLFHLQGVNNVVLHIC